MCEAIYIAVSRALSKAKPCATHSHQYKEQWDITLGSVTEALKEFPDFDIVKFLESAEHPS
jgi:hypothetical protein